MTRWQSRNDKQCRDYDMMTSSFFYSLCHHVSTPHREDKMMMMHNYPPDQSKVRNHFAKEELITGEIDLYSHKLILLLLSISFCCTVLVIELSITSLSLSLSSQLPPHFCWSQTKHPNLCKRIQANAWIITRMKQGWIFVSSAEILLCHPWSSHHCFHHLVFIMTCQTKTTERVKNKQQSHHVVVSSLCLCHHHHWWSQHIVVSSWCWSLHLCHHCLISDIWSSLKPWQQRE